MGYYWGSELYHWGRSKTDGAPGRGSGRYPLGSGDRPYQGQPKLLAKFKKEKKESTPPVQKTKEEILVSSSAQEVSKLLRTNLTNNELQYIANRLKIEKEILEYASAEAYANSTEKAIKDIGDRIKMTSDIIKIGSEFYNSLAKVYNATSSGQKNPLFLIEGSQGKGKKSENQSNTKNTNKNKWI